MINFYFYSYLAPAWFAQALDQALAQALAPLQQAIAQNHDDLITIRHDLISIRQTTGQAANSSSSAPGQSLSMIPNNLGVNPPNCFPSKVKQLNELSNVQIDILLNFYGLPIPHVAASHGTLLQRKRAELSDFI